MFKMNYTHNVLKDNETTDVREGEAMDLTEDNHREKEKSPEPESTAKSEPKATPTPSSTKVSDTRYHRVYSKCQR